ncbi:hypothetical protein ONS95_009271 [Cadophora gregata]|uniref:uncharacterized protein n=1 Tax=Cadophora gregata TaxID=51156 RepID=UPI0026DB62A1|nr:uncharacterized protein ONS95_009271 [Cadophora gregata]KAK0124300.1 hypothetical protein ONS95_009271 [Cadophora gregata]KAK0129845.1 hypothetical protein ONS96_000394 [Cadophora gregata f. sp. sojae]
MAPGLIFFTGSPSARTLSWDQDALLNTFIEPIAQFIGLASDSVSAVSSHPQWRSLPLNRQHLNTGLTPPDNFDQYQLFTGYSETQEAEDTSFFTTSQVELEFSQAQILGDSFPSTQASVSQVLSQFYEESYARHEDVPSSQIAPTSEGPSSFTSDEFSSNSASFDSQYQAPGSKKEVPIAGHLTDLKNIPKAAYLSSIQPQTMTVNLIVGIISLPQPRAVRTRRGADVSLVEILVGDETKSGFGVNFWLSSSQPTGGDMRTVLECLRPQDVVLIRNVALNSFRGKVYGQSLRKEMTKVHLLYRNRIDKTDVGGIYRAGELVPKEGMQPQVDKTRRVREWVLKFVGAGTIKTRGKRRASEVLSETLPPDTQ